MRSHSEICAFYAGANVFITGATGFLGKVLLEKLLRTCNSLEKVYLLVREKGCLSVEQRLDQLFNSQIFSKLKIEQPQFRNKIKYVVGDCAQVGLALSLSDRKHLQSRIDIIFHVAATVRFDENLKTAMEINVSGTEAILELAKLMPKLRAIVHVSTAYSNCHLNSGVIEEKFYDFPFKYHSLQTFLSKFNNEIVNEMQPNILSNWPNTYTFTKAMAENLIKNDRNYLPIAIFRPAIIVSTYKEPFIGWVDNLYGPTGIVACACSGILSTMYCEKNFHANIVPVDMCVNALIAISYDVAKNYQSRTKSVPVFNYVSTTDNPLTWTEYLSLNYLYGRNFPFTNSVWLVNFSLCNNYFWNLFQMVLFHYIPAVFFDFIAIVTFKKPKFLKIYQKIYKFSKVISFFCTNDWRFRNENMCRLWDTLNETDKELFNFSIKQINWLTYFRHYVKGIRVYLVNDPLETLQRANLRQKRFIFIQRTVKATFFIISVISLLYMLNNSNLCKTYE